MSVMANSTVNRPSLSRRARARGLQEVAAACRSDAHAYEPPPVANARRLRDACLPAEARGAFAQAFGEMARGKRNLLLGLDLRVVAQAQLDRIERKRLGQFVHRTFER